ncbi:hypothetical protein [Tunicatimonas pelagia]|uniref:hypothetical protein n=1 Tax=Tunicatimonas pelagia TaxID=931531 RepID=UPI0026666F86|nr:hypothetical protein [Tunicatimonas pelagia]WKN40460.1 hypothetical protein P0M28_15555 [Tunicatimonas pelagia]
MRTVFSTLFQSRYFPAYLLSALVVLASCKGDDGGDNPTPNDLTAQQERARDLVGTWASNNDNITAPTDTEDAAQQELQALTMTFAVNNNTDLAPGSFSSEGADTYFSDGSGATWAWTSNDSTNVSDVTLNAVSPVAAFSISNFDGSTMTIRFDFEGASTGRFAGIGEYTIQMTKQQ